MAYAQVTITPFASSNAAWQAWAGAVSAALDTAGLTKVADTGATASIGTATKPGSANSTPYFEIRKLNDPPSGGSPVYMRFNYGVGSSTNFVALTVAVGTGTDGAGTLTGPGSAVAAVATIPNSSDTARTLLVAGDGDGFVMAHCYDSSTMNSLLIIDRQRNASGGAAPMAGYPNTGFVRIAKLGINGLPNVLTVDPVAGETIATSRWPIVSGRTLTGSSSMVNGAGEMTQFPLFLPSRQGLYTSKMLVAVPVLDANVNTLVDTPLLGATRTFVAMGAQYTGCDAVNSTGVGCMVWRND